MNIDCIDNQQKILEIFLGRCLYSGWNQEALKEAAREAKIDPKFLPFIFANGCLDLANLFISQKNQQLIQKANQPEFQASFKTMKVGERIKSLLKLQLEIYYPHQRQLKKLIDFYFQNKSIANALKNNYETANLIWQIAGDQSTDFNFYSKRIILVKINLRILHCFASDDSIDYQKTINLLDQQIAKVLKFSAFKFKVKNKLQQAKACFKENISGKTPCQIIKKLPFFRLK